MATTEIVLQAHPSLTRSRDQRTRVVLEEPRIANAASFTFQHPNLVPGEKEIPARVQVYTHNGGVDNTVDGTWNVSDGDTFIFEVWDPDIVGGGETDADGNPVFTKITHSLAGVTGGAATPGEVSDSLQQDTELNKWLVAANGLTANRVTIFPK